LWRGLAVLLVIVFFACGPLRGIAFRCVRRRLRMFRLAEHGSAPTDGWEPEVNYEVHSPLCNDSEGNFCAAWRSGDGGQAAA